MSIEYYTLWGYIFLCVELIYIHMINEFIAKKVFNLRQGKNVSARKLSIDLGQTASYINKVENCKIVPSFEVLENICDYFGITIFDFFDHDQNYPIEYKEIFSELNKLSKEEIDQVINLIKMINNNKSKNHH